MTRLYYRLKLQRKLQNVELSQLSAILTQAKQRCWKTFVVLWYGAYGWYGARAKGRSAQPVLTGWKWNRKNYFRLQASAMQFPYKDHTINVDTPGHQDFSEDTYRTLTAADSAIMVIDAAKGVELQTRKLFSVCRLPRYSYCLYQ